MDEEASTSRATSSSTPAPTPTTADGTQQQEQQGRAGGENQPANHNNNNNNNNDGIVGGGGSVRDRMLYMLFVKVTLAYGRLIPQTCRRVIEFVMLLKALTFLLILAYVHMTFSGQPASCLSRVRESWPRDGVLRVEIVSKVVPSVFDVIGLPPRGAACPFYDQYNHVSPFADAHFAYGNSTHSFRIDLAEVLRKGRIPRRTDAAFHTLDLASGRYVFAGQAPFPFQQESKSLWDLLGLNFRKFTHFAGGGAFYWPSYGVGSKGLVEEEAPIGEDSEPTRPSLEELQGYRFMYENAIEYSLEYGYLRLSQEKRDKLGIPVLTVQLDPEHDACFGDWLTKFILREFLGYDDLLMSSVKALAENETSNKGQMSEIAPGYLRNLLTGEHYRFVTAWMNRSSYVVAAFIMIIFTFAISMLLRFSHHQIFVFILDVIHSFEQNSAFAIPLVPLMTVVLALVGMEAIMSEIFHNDTGTAFYVILIVWVADQYDAICCHTTVSKRHWLRFFYLYHYGFYAYHYRFNGQYSGLALLTSWLFIQHSMLFFYHHYEMPLIIHQQRVQRLIEGMRQADAANTNTNANTDAADSDATASDANNSATANSGATGGETLLLDAGGASSTLLLEGAEEEL